MRYVRLVPTTQRRPRGYTGLHHETIGSDILAVLGSVKNDDVLGPYWKTQLHAVEPGGWYPIGMLLDLLNHINKVSGRASLVKMGRQLFVDSHQQRVGPAAKSAADIIFGIDAMYHHANRGEGLGGWAVVRFGPGLAVLEKTTPHHCALEEGILHEGLHSVGADALIVQTQCFHEGAESCVFELRSATRDQRWLGGHAPVP